MSTTGGIVVVVLSLVMGFAGGYVEQMTLGKTAKTTTSTTTTTTKKTSLADCLKEVWGDDKYAAISANSSLATTADNLAALKCYE